MSYAVQQFFLNGGSDAIVVRLANSGVKASAELVAGSDKLELEAADVGREGNKLAVAVNHEGVSSNDHFNLIINRTYALPLHFG